MSGMVSDCGGRISDTMSRNTVVASSTVRDNVIFSPASEGSTNTSIPVKVRNVAGRMRLKR